jgi:hypothetical protein
MKLYQFKFLDEVEQLEAIKLQGVYLAERREENYTFKLFQIDDFYVEEKWHTAFNERRALNPFVSVQQLQPYLEVMDLTSLLAAKEKP